MLRVVVVFLSCPNINALLLLNHIIHILGIQTYFHFLDIILRKFIDSSFFS